MSYRKKMMSIVVCCCLSLLVSCKSIKEETPPIETSKSEEPMRKVDRSVITLDKETKAKETFTDEPVTETTDTQVHKGQRKGKLPDGTTFTYKGGLLGEEFHGKGTLVYSNGITYQGEFRHGKFHGYGILTHPDGKRYEGEFLNNEFHGTGVLTDSKGKQHKGEFREGQQVK